MAILDAAHSIGVELSAIKYKISTFIYSIKKRQQNSQDNKKARY